MRLAQYIFHVVLITISVLIVFTVPAIAVDQKLMINRQVILESLLAGVVLDPHVITQTNDGGFLVAGTTGSAQQGWAIKTDSRGSALWRYTTGLHDKLPPADSPTFDDAVVMPDGSSYLCGFMPVPSGKYQPALLTHLDPAGHALYERLLAPKNNPEHGLAYLTNIVRLSDGIALLGHVLSFSSGREEHFYWLLALDAKGQIKWEKLIPTTFDKLRDIGPLLTQPDSSLVFSGVRVNNGTEIFRFCANGEIEAQTKMSNEFLSFSLPEAAPDRALQMYGYSATGSFETVILDDQLKVTEQRHAMQRFEFDAYLAYRTPNHSLTLFGTGRGEQDRQRVLLLDPELQHGKFLKFPGEKYEDFMAVKAASPTGQAGEYVIARPLLKQVPGTSGIYTRLDAIGAALDFIGVQ